MVSIAFCLSAALAATDAGRPGESGTGAMWVAPELVRAPLGLAGCSQTTQLAARELVFEMLEPGEADDLPGLLAGSAREVVEFEWDAARGELGLRTAGSSQMFSDLVSSSRASQAPRRNCGSR